MKPITFLDLFCGAGGLSSGFKNEDYICLAGIDLDSMALKTFKLNHPEAFSCHSRLESLDKNAIFSIVKKRKVDLLLGGPPCQGFSSLGKNNLNDPRNDLFKEYLRVVSILKPTFIVFENVSNFMSYKYEDLRREFFFVLKKMKYNFTYGILDASDYGVAQKRKRFFLIGSLMHQPSFPESSFKKVLVKDCFHDFLKRKTLYNHDLELACKIKDIDFKRLNYIKPGQGIRYYEDNLLLPKKLRLDYVFKNLPEKRLRQKKLHRLDLHSFAPTIVTSATQYYHPTELRLLTCREAAACQSFSWNFKFIGSRTSIMKQIGNAVPPKLAQALARNLLKEVLINKSLTFR